AGEDVHRGNAPLCVATEDERSSRRAAMKFVFLAGFERARLLPTDGLGQLADLYRESVGCRELAALIGPGKFRQLLGRRLIPEKPVEDLRSRVPGGHGHAHAPAALRAKGHLPRRAKHELTRA